MDDRMSTFGIDRFGCVSEWLKPPPLYKRDWSGEKFQRRDKPEILYHFGDLSHKVQKVGEDDSPIWTKESLLRETHLENFP